MIRQYGAQRSMGGPNPLRVGTIPTGAIFRIQPDRWWRDRFRPAPPNREPEIVEGFTNGTIGAARRNRDTGMWESTYASNRSDMAVVRSLRTGRRREVAVRTLHMHEEEGFRMDGCSYPTRPDLSLYRIRGAKTRLPLAA